VTPRRIVLLIVLVLLGGLFVQPLRGYRDADQGLERARADLREARQQHAALKRELDALDSRAALVAEAREQGYIFPGETPFAVAGR